MTGGGARKALVTMAIGDRYARLFETHCRANWTAYANRHHYDLIVFDRPLDASPRAQARSPAWQKCLIAESADTRGYERIVWVDADILINPDAPSIVECVPETKVGAVDAYGMPTPAIYRDILARQYARWRRAGVAFVDNLTPDAFYQAWGLPGAPGGEDRVTQTGVLVLTPSHHRDLLKRVYDSYEEKGGAEWNFEMRPLSWELVRTGMVHWLDWRFNLVVSDIFAWHYPFLADNIFRPFEATNPKEVTGLMNHLVMGACLRTAFANAWFLHFAGQQSLMDAFAESGNA